MSELDFRTFDSKGRLLAAIRRQSDDLMALAAAEGAWEAPTAAGHWQVRDIVAHLVDTTEGYLTGFDAARDDGAAPEPLGARGMEKHTDGRALALRGRPRDALLDRLRIDRSTMLTIFEALGPDDWEGLVVPHRYMGPLPAYFYPVAQLIDYAVHSWDIRQGTGRSHALDGDAADLLVPPCFVVWQLTADCEGVDPFTLGVRVSGDNGGETRVSITSDGLDVQPGEIDDLPLVLEFDPGSFVLTAMGRINGGTARGDPRLADRFCNLFFRI